MSFFAVTGDKIIITEVCTKGRKELARATMNTDPETKEPILHIGGFTIREEVEKALEKDKARKIKEKTLCKR